MTLAKNTGFIILALFIDGLQAAVSWGIAIIATFPGTAAGGVVGCAAGNAVAGQIGCWVGGSVLGLLGTTGNLLLAPATIPVGIAIGFAVNVTLSIVLGWAFLVPLMFFFRNHISWKRLAWGGGEMIPGVNNVPFWTFFVIASLWDESTVEKESRGSFFSITKKRTLANQQSNLPSRQPVTIFQRSANDTGEAIEETVPESGKVPSFASSRVPLPNMSFDVRPPRADNDNYQPYAKAA